MNAKVHADSHCSPSSCSLFLQDGLEGGQGEGVAIATCADRPDLAVLLTALNLSPALNAGAKEEVLSKTHICPEGKEIPRAAPVGAIVL